MSDEMVTSKLESMVPELEALQMQMTLRDTELGALQAQRAKDTQQVEALQAQFVGFLSRLEEMAADKRAMDQHLYMRELIRRWQRSKAGRTRLLNMKGKVGLAGDMNIVSRLNNLSTKTVEDGVGFDENDTTVEERRGRSKKKPTRKPSRSYKEDLKEIKTVLNQAFQAEIGDQFQAIAMQLGGTNNSFHFATTKKAGEIENRLIKMAEDGLLFANDINVSQLFLLLLDDMKDKSKDETEC